MMRGLRKMLAKTPRKKVAKIVLFIFIIIYGSSYFLSQSIFMRYQEQTSQIVQDRTGAEILIRPNTKGHYMRRAESVPKQFSNLLIAKEDRFFFYHPGINPVSVVRNLLQYPFSRRSSGSSTITQQLVKTLLGYENKRTLQNKIIESFYTMSIELHASKKEIIQMYADTAYFGNRAEGVVEASKTYFNIPPSSLDTKQTLELLATLNNPSDYPGTVQNKQKTAALARRLKISLEEKDISTEENGQSNYSYSRNSINMFELGPLDSGCTRPCSLTIDESLTDTVRKILKTNLESPSFASVNNGAIIIIRLNKEQEANELISIVGSPNPESSSGGRQINMAISPRPIGSTAKPFIYAKAFEKGARPYTQVEDIEYKYDIGTGFAFYPKNYDGKYRGTVTLHEALSNSLNVPAVRVLQYAGIENFYDFLKNDLSFESLQPLEKYELSIALGGLEMDLLTLSNYFTIFPNEGVLKPLKISENNILKLPMAKSYDQRRGLDPPYAQLVTKILSDRETSIDQFGLKSNLNLPSRNYALKTGTSYDYHDSWTIGYTPDFLVGVWLGNSDNKPMYKLSGSTGAGKVWHEVMETLLNSQYNQKTDFNFEHVKEYTNSGSIEFGLAGDFYNTAQKLLETGDLILQPHNFDTLQYTPGMKVPLVSREYATWLVDNLNIGDGTERTWQPTKTGTYTITANTTAGKTEKITVIIKNEE